MQVRSFVEQRDVTVHAPTVSRPPSRAKPQSCAGLPAEQGALLSNHSSAGLRNFGRRLAAVERATDRAHGFFYDF